MDGGSPASEQTSFCGKIRAVRGRRAASSLPPNDACHQHMLHALFLAIFKRWGRRGTTASVTTRGPVPLTCGSCARSLGSYVGTPSRGNVYYR